jgi:Divergent InlB B-repeat domain
MSFSGTRAVGVEIEGDVAVDKRERSRWSRPSRRRVLALASLILQALAGCSVDSVSFSHPDGGTDVPPDSRMEPGLVKLTVERTGTGTGAVTSNPAGIDCGAGCSLSLPLGTMVTLVATANTDSLFSGWLGGGCSGTGECTVTVDGAKTVAASFTKAARLGIGVVIGLGSITSSPSGIRCQPDCAEVVPVGTPMTLSATPAPGWVFVGWMDGGCTGSGTCTVTVNSNTFVTAIFQMSSFDLGVQLSGQGTVDSMPGGLSCPGNCIANFPRNTMVTLRATPSPGWHFDGWSGSGCSGTGSCTVTMSFGQGVTASFAIDTAPPSLGSPVK